MTFRSAGIVALVGSIALIGGCTVQASSTTATPSTPSSLPAFTVAATSSAPSSRPTSAAIDTTTAAASTTTVLTTTVLTPTSTPYVLPVVAGVKISYAHVHHDYPATDVFAAGGCGAELVSPVNGTILESRRENRWDPTTDDPATRGGKSVSIRGDDGVRYYLAHFESIVDGIEPNVQVSAGQPLGVLGRTGSASACHVHFAISPPCPGKEWSVRRGVVGPWRYLDSWRTGGQLSPVAEVDAWIAAHPLACALAMADPHAAES